MMTSAMESLSPPRTDATAADAARAAALDVYDVIGRPPEPELEALVELAALVCGVPTAVINLIDETHQHQVAAFGIGPSICTREDSMCEVTIQQQSPIVLADARLDPRFARNPFVTGVIASLRFYASSQLRTPAGVTIGTLCVFDEEERHLTPAQAGAVDALARQIVDVLELRRRTTLLEQSLEELTLARAELSRSNDQLAAFAGQVSHDLRNPLTAVMGYVQELADLPSVAEDPEGSWLVERAGQSAARMYAQMTELLDYGHVGGRLGSEEVDLGRLAYLVRDDLGDLIRAGGAEIVIHTLPVVRGDENQLRSVLQNLISNALKFTLPGVPAHVTVSAWRGATGMRVEVADRGVGVPVGQAAGVFTLFERTGQLDVEGHGIGLATCRRVIEAHGGRIGLESRDGGGTVAWFELPDAAG
ncbi:MAG: ATP-binding protein [Oryzihumus sp.]